MRLSILCYSFHFLFRSMDLFSMLAAAKTRDELYKISRHAQDVMHQIEQSKKPIVAAIAGSCLGGGFEVRYFRQRYLSLFYSLLILIR